MKQKQKKVNYYTILLGSDIWEDVIDDMNTTKIWAIGGMVWKSYEKALAYMKHLQLYDFETPKKKFSIKQLYF